MKDQLTYILAPLAVFSKMPEILLCLDIVSAMDAIFIIVLLQALRS